MASDDRLWLLEETKLKLLEDTRLKMEEKYKTSISKVQTVPSYLREQDKYEKYYLPKLISIGPIHHGDPNLKRGEDYKLMWASMYAREIGKTPQDLYQRIANNIEELRGLFLWEQLKHAHDYSKKDLAWMLFVDGCSVLQILAKANLSKPEDLNVKIDILVIVERDLLLLENQLPYRLLELLCEDVPKLKISMHFFCKLQNMFTVSESPHSMLSRELEHEIMILMFSSPPAHLLDCLRSSILSNEMESIDKENHQADMARNQMRILIETKNLVHQLNELQLDNCPIEDLAEDQPVKVESPQNVQQREPEDQIEIAMQSPSPTHLPDGPLTSNLRVTMESITKNVHNIETQNQLMLLIQQKRNSEFDHYAKEISLYLQKAIDTVLAENLWDVAHTYSNRNKKELRNYNKLIFKEKLGQICVGRLMGQTKFSVTFPVKAISYVFEIGPTHEIMFKIESETEDFILSRLL